MIRSQPSPIRAYGTHRSAAADGVIDAVGSVIGAAVCAAVPALVWVGLVWLVSSAFGAEPTTDLMACVGLAGALIGVIAWASLRAGAIAERR